MTDRSIAAIGRLKNLESLFLDETRITDDAFGSLGDLAKLKYLSLMGTAVSRSSRTAAKASARLRDPERCRQRMPTEVRSTCHEVRSLCSLDQQFDEAGNRTVLAATIGTTARLQRRYYDSRSCRHAAWWSCPVNSRNGASLAARNDKKQWRGPWGFGPRGKRTCHFLAARTVWEENTGEASATRPAKAAGSSGRAERAGVGANRAGHTWLAAAMSGG